MALEQKNITVRVTTDEGSIEYSIVGGGIPVLFIHGGHSNSRETLSHKGFDPDEFQLITPSRPGYGGTPLTGNRTPRAAADLMAGLLAHLSLEEVVVYGISAGGYTALELAANYPEVVKKLILASAVSKQWLDKNDKVYKTAQRIFHPKVERFTWGMVRFFSRIFPAMIAKSFHPQFSKNPLHTLSREEVQELIASLKHYRSHTGFLNDIDQQIQEETLARIQCPTLIIHSENDNSVSFEHALHAHNSIGDSTLIRLQNEWGHLFWMGKDGQEAIEKALEFCRA